MCEYKEISFVINLISDSSLIDGSFFAKLIYRKLINQLVSLIKCNNFVAQSFINCYIVAYRNFFAVEITTIVQYV